MEINLQKIRIYVNAVETGSFTRTAELLNYTQSGVSRTVAELEKDWGVILLERGKNGVRPTAAGVELLPFMQKLILEAESLQQQVDAINGLQSGLIRIGSFSSVATHWLPNIIRSFQKDFPNIEYEILLGDYLEIEDWVRNGRIDCGFIRLPTRPEFETIFLERDLLMAVLPEGHPLCAYEKVPAAALCAEPFLLQEKGENAEISRFLKQNGLKPNVRFTTWDDYAIMSMVESGMGVSILPPLILRRVPYKIVTRELDIPAMRDIGLTMRSRENASLAVKRFLDYLNNR